MKQRVHIETTIPGYLSARPTRDLIQAARQAITRDWWDRRRRDFDLYTSQVVVDEAGKGDPEAAQRRLEAIRDVPRIEANDAALAVARTLVADHALPAKAAEDALHVGIAAAHGMDFLLTWNCKHLANAQMMEAIRSSVNRCGCQCPYICTPEELMGD